MVGIVAAVLGVMLVGIGILAAILVPNFIRARSQGQFTACKSNLKNMATALEMWSTDHEGRYPSRLSELTEGGQYLRMIPTCPAAGIDTYSSTYQAGQDPDQYQVGCSGHNHGGVDAGPGYPQYNSVSGLNEK